jgi:hypothetical protein
MIIIEGYIMKSDKKTEQTKKTSEYKHQEGQNLAQLADLFGELRKLADKKASLDRMQMPLANTPSSQPSAEKPQESAHAIEERVRDIHHQIMKIVNGVGIHEVQVEKIDDSGMTYKHNFAVSKYAVSNDVVLIWRPINPEAAKRLEGKNPYMGKSLNTKGKSSTFGPIAGDIPFDAALSKAAMDPKLIQKFQEKNQHEVEESNNQMAKIAGKITQKNIADINDLLLVKTIDKTVEVGGETERKLLYYLKDTKGNVAIDEMTNEPLFFVQLAGDTADSKEKKSISSKPPRWYAYDKNSKQFTRPINLSTYKTFSPEVVKIMAYRQFEFEDGTLKEKSYPITADYDELTSAPCKLYPFHNNLEIHTIFTFPKSLHNKMAERTLTTAEQIDLMAQVIFTYEQRLKQEDIDALATATPGMGYIKEWQWAAKRYLKDVTAGATNHGSEANNPFPEKFSIGNHAVHLPNGGIEILRNEHEICAFINEWRKKGFPLDVNPKWGWDINEKTGELFVPASHLDWDGIRKDLDDARTDFESEQADLFKQLIKSFGIEENEDTWQLWVELSEKEPSKEQLNDFLKKIAIHGNSPTEAKQRSALTEADLEKITKYLKERIGILTSKYKQLKMNEIIVNLKVELERVRLEPKIIYSDTLDYLRTPPDENPQQKAFRRAVVAKVKELEDKAWHDKKTSLKIQLNVWQDKIKKDYRTSSILQKHERLLPSSTNPLTSSTSVPSGKTSRAERTTEQKGHLPALRSVLPTLQSSSPARNNDPGLPKGLKRVPARDPQRTNIGAHQAQSSPANSSASLFSSSANQSDKTSSIPGNSGNKATTIIHKPKSPRGASEE